MDAVQFLLICLGVVVLGSFVLAAYVIVRLVGSINRPYPREEDEPQAVQVEEQQKAAPALPIDMSEPPTIRIYRGADGKRSCHCHDEPILNGDTVLWWPLPGSDAVVVFCEVGVREKGGSL
jgi:hypothetical protein